MEKRYLHALFLSVLLLLCRTAALQAQTTPCATSYIVVSTDAASCTGTPPGSGCTGAANASTFRTKIRVYFATPIAAGVPTPNITSAANGPSNLLSSFRFCISGDPGPAAPRTYVDYCVYGTSGSGAFPGGGLKLRFTSTGQAQSALCDVANNLPCPTSFVCLSDGAAGCTPCVQGFNNVVGKIRVFLYAPLPAGVGNPNISSIANAGGNLNQYKLCAATTSATDVERSYIDYCVFTGANGTALPTSSSLILTLQLGSYSIQRCTVPTSPVSCPNAYVNLGTVGNCTPCDPAFSLSAGTLRVFYPSGIAAGLPNPEVTSIASGNTILSQFKLCAQPGTGINTQRTYVDYCVYSNVAGSALPNTALTFNVKPSTCGTAQACTVSPTPPLPCIEGVTSLAVTTGPNGAGGTAAGCSNSSTCNGSTVYFAGTIDVALSPCLAPGRAAPALATFTRTDANGIVVSYCFQETAASAAQVGQQRCSVQYCVYSTQSGDTYFDSNTPQSLNTTYSVTVNGSPVSLTQAACPPEGIILPIRFGPFTATRNNDKVQLKWETLSESNNRGFSIERTTAGGWQALAFVGSQASGGNSNTSLTYTFIDVNTFRGLSHYRLKQVDLTGETYYSAIRTVQGPGASARLLLYPNPGKGGSINVLLEGDAVKDISVRDITGKVVRRYEGVKATSLVLRQLSSGVYTIQVTDRSSAASTFGKFVIE